MAPRDTNFHESVSRTDDVKTSSEKGFGYTVGGIFAAIGLIRYFYGHSDALSFGLMAGGLLLVLCAWLCAPALKPLNYLWTKLGLVLHSIMNPLVMFILLYGTITPFGLLMRAFGKDPLQQKKQPDAVTYWTARAPHEPAPKTMENQF